MVDHHPLLKSAGWIKLIVTAVVAVAGAISVFPNIIINRVQPSSEPRIVRVSNGDLVKHDGKITRATCRSLAENHKNTRYRAVLDTYGVPDGGEQDLGTGWLTYPLRGEKDGTCSLNFDYDDKLYSVEMTISLWRT